MAPIKINNPINTASTLDFNLNVFLIHTTPGFSKYANSKATTKGINTDFKYVTTTNKPTIANAPKNHLAALSNVMGSLLYMGFHSKVVDLLNLIMCYFFSNIRLLQG